MSGLRTIGKALSAPGLALEYISLQRSQWHDPDQLHKLQSARLSHILKTAKEIPFYRERLQECSVNPKELSALIHPVSKRELRETPLEQRVQPGADMDSLVRLHTSGTTAEPFAVVLSRREKDRRVLPDIRALQANQIGLRDLTLSFRHLKNIPGGGARESFLGLFPRAYASFEMPAAERLELIMQLQPQCVAAQPSSFVPMAEILTKTQQKLPALKRLVCYTEFLDHNQRELIETAFGVPIMNHYGTIEVAFIAWQCPLSPALHINAETHLLEAVDDHDIPVPEGEPGELLVTSLLQKTHPFIRYRTGDRGTISNGKCVCGRGLPSLTLSRGRTIDRLYDIHGNEVSPHLFTVLWEGIQGILQFQVLQRSYSEILYRYVLQNDLNSAAVEKELSTRIKKLLGEDMVISFERLSRIDATPGAKFKSFVSLIRSEINHSGYDND